MAARCLYRATQAFRDFPTSAAILAHRAVPIDAGYSANAASNFFCSSCDQSSLLAVVTIDGDADAGEAFSAWAE